MTEIPSWDDLGFRFRPTDCIYRCAGDADRDPVWGEGEFLPFGDVTISPAAAVLSYGCGVFEGLKAERGSDGRVRLFRASDHGARFGRSARLLEMPVFPQARFVEAVRGLVAHNLRFVPPAGRGAFYVRPMLHGIEPMLGLARVRRFAVTMWGAPVGDYFAGRNGAGVRLKAVPFCRSAPGGTGGAKALGNYAGTLMWRRAAAAAGYDDVLYLDAAGRGFVSEASGANFFCVLDDGSVVTPPLDDTILAGITRDSVIRIARTLGGRKVHERPLPLEEVYARGREAFCTGTGWTVRSVDEIASSLGECRFESREVAEGIGAILREIRSGVREDGFGWTQIVATNGVSAEEET